ncbi:hypothetical protein GIY30_15130 [Gordonia sp. HNM0687]|uniref:Polyketide cyclase / dehydrase and lipid transport n=1 Tax=Gordonia mangrovi TaxID=2665643 RepID=A0A6L7GSZ9_9ACTN|nr:hypothetical protein [Gordonia mangrovi]MXP22673.1 hypothetical protein [Gordonia mangrovi]UVF76997.1 hypothetical protein NWF22_16930 [Gordonia mangrovi]
MSGTQIMWTVIGVILALGVIGLIGLAILYALAKRPDRFRVRAIGLDDVDAYVAKRASLAITVVETTPLSRREVWDRIAGSAYLGNLPLVHGPHWTTGSGPADASSPVRSGRRRWMSGTFLAVSEQVIEVADRERLTLTGDGVSVPLAVKGFVERFTIADGERSGTVVVTWEIAGSPRWIGFLPWRWTAPLLRPLLGSLLRHILRLTPFRSSDVRDGTAA